MRFSDTKIKIACEICGTEVERTRKSYRESLHRGYRITCNKFCAAKCKLLPKKSKRPERPKRVIVNDGKFYDIIPWPHTERNKKNI